MRRPAREVSVLTVLFVAAGCRTPTQVTVELTTDVPCDELPSTTAQVGRLGLGLEDRPPSVATLACTSEGRIGSFVVVPSGDRNDDFGVKVVLAHGGPSTADCAAAELQSTMLAGCIRARRALRFIPHDELTLPIALRRDCDGVLCPPLMTCVHGACTSATIADPRWCRGAGCVDTTLPPGETPDSGRPDSGDSGVADPCANGACPRAPSCEKLEPNCGTPPMDDCCRSPLVAGGSFKRDNAVQTTVSSVRIDKYEVTVGRFRPFVDAVVAGYRPTPGSGKHVHIPSGGLTNAYDMDRLEGGWDPAWNVNVASDWATWNDVQHLSCPKTSWTASSGNDERKPITCVNWFEAYAFCIWDGGFLPSYNEFNYARMGGDEERPFPWGTEPITPDRAAFCSSGDCQLATSSNVGSKPLGDGRYLQSDLVGGAWDWVLDGNNGFMVCKDCIFFVNPPTDNVMVGGAFDSPPDQLDISYLTNHDSLVANGSIGFRCARVP